MNRNLLKGRDIPIERKGGSGGHCTEVMVTLTEVVDALGAPPVGDVLAARWVDVKLGQAGAEMWEEGGVGGEPYGGHQDATVGVGERDLAQPPTSSIPIRCPSHIKPQPLAKS